MTTSEPTLTAAPREGTVARGRPPLQMITVPVLSGRNAVCATVMVEPNLTSGPALVVTSTFVVAPQPVTNIADNARARSAFMASLGELLGHERVDRPTLLVGHVAVGAAVRGRRA